VFLVKHSKCELLENFYRIYIFYLFAYIFFIKFYSTMNGISNLGQSAGIQGTEQISKQTQNPIGIGQNRGDLVIKAEEGKDYNPDKKSIPENAQNVGSMQKAAEPKQATGKFGSVKLTNPQGNSKTIGGGASFEGESLQNRIENII
jgi:hypothetical protein